MNKRFFDAMTKQERIDYTTDVLLTCFNDSMELAQRFIRLAIERAIDLNHNPIVVLLIMKKFAEVSIHEYRKTHKGDNEIAKFMESAVEMQVDEMIAKARREFKKEQGHGS